MVSRHQKGKIILTSNNPVHKHIWHQQQKETITPSRLSKIGAKYRLSLAYRNKTKQEFSNIQLEQNPIIIHQVRRLLVSQLILFMSKKREVYEQQHQLAVMRIQLHTATHSDGIYRTPKQQKKQILSYKIWNMFWR